jgi:mRNA interferase YafQ
MRETEQSAAFKRDAKREGKSPNLTILNAVLPQVLADLANDIPLAAKYKDHALTGNWVGYRECHIRPDLLLVYVKIGETVDSEELNGELHLARLGSHSEIFG